MIPSELETRLQLLESEVAAIQERNQRVEENKRWETSLTRLATIATITYFTMTLVFLGLDSRHPLLDAIVPTAGFVLSAQSLSVVRRIWEKLRKTD